MGDSLPTESAMSINVSKQFVKIQDISVFEKLCCSFFRCSRALAPEMQSILHKKLIQCFLIINVNNNFIPKKGLFPAVYCK